jgi:hypothetical protein
MILGYENQLLQQIGGFMTVAKNHSTPQPLIIDVSNTALHLSPEQLDRLRLGNPDLNLELTEDGKLMAIPAESVGERGEAAVASEVSPQQSSPIADSIPLEKYQFPELTPTEIARRVAMVEKHQQERAQMWNSLTLEEQAESNRQFENLYKLLEDARK